MNRHPVRGTVYAEGTTWYYVVSDGTKVVLADNTGDRGVVVASCIANVELVRRVLAAGLYFPWSWNEAVRDDLSPRQDPEAVTDYESWLGNDELGRRLSKRLINSGQVVLVAPWARRR